MTVDVAMDKMLTAYPDVLDTSQIAEILCLDAHNVRRKIRAGEIPGIVVGARYRTAKACLLEYLIGDTKGGAI